MLINMNEEQKEVIQDWNNNILLTAIPGSGKTRTIVYKIIEELRNSSDNRLIVAITYTNRAAEEMLERIEKEIDDMSRLFIGTIHSFCYEYIFKRNIDKTLFFSKGYKIISPEYESELIKTIADTKLLSKEEQNIVKFNFNTTINKDGSYNVANHNFISILDEFYTILNKNGLVNFNSLLYESYVILNKNPFLASNLKKAINRLYVDEYQDTHQLQYDIITSIFKSNTDSNQQLLFVGDSNQAIYSSLGSVYKSMENLKLEFGTEFISKALVGCYRSDSQIIEYYKNFAVNDMEMVPRVESTYDAKIEHYHLNDEETYTKVTELINSCLQNGVKDSEICIMAPWWYLLVPISQKLRDLMPTVKFDAPEITPIKRNDDLPLYKLSKLICMKISHDNINYKRRISRDFKMLFKDFYGITLNYTTDELLTIIEKRRPTNSDSNGTEYLKQEMEFILYTFLGITSEVIEKDLNIFITEIIERVNTQRFKLTNTIDSFTSMFSRKKGIVISTCHGVKGEEYDVVICLNVNEGKIPHFSSVNNRDEAKKLLFVMFSRARKEVHVFSKSDDRNGPTNEIGPYLPDTKMYN